MTSEFRNARVALVHDWLTTFGGAERVLLHWGELFPDAPIHTLIYNEKVLGSVFPKGKVRTSRLQRLPHVHRYYRKLLPLMPRAFEEFDLSGYDLVLSSSSSCAKGVLTSSSTYHASYIHTPMRYAWDLYPEYLARSGVLTRMAMRRLMSAIRQWDVASANRVDTFICNSREVARRIRKVYRRNAIVVHPPIATHLFTPADEEDIMKRGAGLGESYLTVGRLIPYKRIDLAVKACTETNRRLDIIGTGPELNRLKAMAGPSIRFLGFCSDETILEAYRNCRAFLFPGLEDFGMTPLEAQSCGRPVLAFGRGGALETIREGTTGLFFSEQRPSALIEAMEKFEAKDWNPTQIRKHAEEFNEERHKNQLLETLERGWNEFFAPGPSQGERIDTV